MLCDFYSSYAIYREVEKENSFGHLTKQGNWEIDHYENGFIQPRSGSYPQVNQKKPGLSSHVFYCNYDVDILVGDRIGDNLYQVTFVQPMGIGGISDHQEIDIDYIGDM